MSSAIDHLHPGDDVLADKGFDIQDDFACKHIPSFLKENLSSVRKKWHTTKKKMLV